MSDEIEFSPPVAKARSPKHGKRGPDKAPRKRADKPDPVPLVPVSDGPIDGSPADSTESAPRDESSSRFEFSHLTPWRSPR